MSALIARMKELGIELRIVTVGDASRDRTYFSDFGGAEFITSTADAVYATDEVDVQSPARSALPLVLLGLALAGLLTLAEPLLPLRWRPAEPESRV